MNPTREVPVKKQRLERLRVRLARVVRRLLREQDPAEKRRLGRKAHRVGKRLLRESTSTQPQTS